MVAETRILTIAKPDLLAILEPLLRAKGEKHDPNARFRIVHDPAARSITLLFVATAHSVQLSEADVLSHAIAHCKQAGHRMTEAQPPRLAVAAQGLCLVTGAPLEFTGNAQASDDRPADDADGPALPLADYKSDRNMTLAQLAMMPPAAD